MQRMCTSIRDVNKRSKREMISKADKSLKLEVSRQLPRLEMDKTKKVETTEVSNNGQTKWGLAGKLFL